MADNMPDSPQSFLGTGWSFPPEFHSGGSGASEDEPQGGVALVSDAEDIASSLRILFGTTVGERFLVPAYGLDMQELLFDPVSTTLRTYLEDRISTTILIYEPRIRLLSLRIDPTGLTEGILRIFMEYEIQATNSRYNLVFPFYRSDSNELTAALGAGGLPLLPRS